MLGHFLGLGVIGTKADSQVAHSSLLEAKTLNFNLSSSRFGSHDGQDLIELPFLVVSKRLCWSSKQLAIYCDLNIEEKALFILSSEPLMSCWRVTLDDVWFHHCGVSEDGTIKSTKHLVDSKVNEVTTFNCDLSVPVLWST